MCVNPSCPRTQRYWVAVMRPYAGPASAARTCASPPPSVACPRPMPPCTSPAALQSRQPTRPAHSCTACRTAQAARRRPGTAQCLHRDGGTACTKGHAHLSRHGLDEARGCHKGVMVVHVDHWHGPFTTAASPRATALQPPCLPLHSTAAAPNATTDAVQVTAVAARAPLRHHGSHLRRWRGHQAGRQEGGVAHTVAQHLLKQLVPRQRVAPACAHACTPQGQWVPEESRGAAREGKADMRSPLPPDAHRRVPCSPPPTAAPARAPTPARSPPLATGP